MINNQLFCFLYLTC